MLSVVADWSCVPANIKHSQRIAILAAVNIQEIFLMIKVIITIINDVIGNVIWLIIEVYVLTGKTSSIPKR